MDDPDYPLKRASEFFKTEMIGNIFEVMAPFRIVHVLIRRLDQLNSYRLEENMYYRQQNYRSTFTLDFV
jgi:rRNA processing protein Gar1